MKTKILWCSEFTSLNTGYAIYSKELISRLKQIPQFDIAEFASYVAVNHPQLQNYPWKVYGNVPAQQFDEAGNIIGFVNESEVQAYNSNLMNQFGALRFENVCLDFRPHVVCILPKSEVVTQNGIVKIKDVNIGDYVLTHTCQYQKVTRKYNRKYIGNVNTITVSHCLFPITITDNHPIYTHKRKHWKTVLPKQKDLKLEWINSENIDKNDLLVYPIDEFGINNLSLDLCRLIGYYTAEGCLMYEGLKKDKILKGIQFTFNSKEQSYIKDVISIVRKEYNKKVKVKYINNTAILRIFDKKIALDMRKYAKSLSGNKKWSLEIMNLNRECSKHLLCGLFRGDGGYDERRGYYNTTSKQLAYQIFKICLRFGILSSFNQNKNTLNNKTFKRYVFSFGSNSYLGFINIYNLIDAKIEPHKRIYGKYALLTIKSIKKKQYDGIVYNLEVENDNSYVTSFCVHNCDIRDYWMMSHEDISPFRPYYKHYIQPTVDAPYQSEEWLEMYKSADIVFTYQDWSLEQLKKEGNGKINLVGSAPPCADKAFIPLDNREEIKKQLGLSGITIFGTVMRNQRRKQFPDLFKTFRMYLDKTGNNKVFLYCHTSYPDRGWDIPNLLNKYGVASKVLFTYTCKNCKYSFPIFFNDALCICPKCNQKSASCSNVHMGVDNKTLCLIYNLFDLYLQISNSEGFGIPLVEAAACGTPILATDFSAMVDVVRKLNGRPLRVLTTQVEPETGCERAVPDNDYLVSELVRFDKMGEEQRKKWRVSTREAFEKNYSWDRTADKWVEQLLKIDPNRQEELWNSPPRFFNPSKEIPQHANIKDYVTWLIINVLGDPSKLDSYLTCRLIRDLNYGSTLSSLTGLYFHEMSQLFSNQINPIPFNREKAYKEMEKLCQRRNYYEKLRTSPTTSG